MAHVLSYAVAEEEARCKYLRGCQSARLKYRVQADDLPATVALLAEQFASECEYYLDEYAAATDAAWLRYQAKRA
jgi:hypothetical protein